MKGKNMDDLVEKIKKFNKEAMNAKPGDRIIIPQGLSGKEIYILEMIKKKRPLKPYCKKHKRFAGTKPTKFKKYKRKLAWWQQSVGHLHKVWSNKDWSKIIVKLYVGDHIEDNRTLLIKTDGVPSEFWSQIAFRQLRNKCKAKINKGEFEELISDEIEQKIKELELEHA